jgi:hypothetical protein
LAISITPYGADSIFTRTELCTAFEQSRLQLEHPTDLDLARGAVLAGVDASERLEWDTLGPFDRLVHRLHLAECDPFLPGRAGVA